MCSASPVPKATHRQDIDLSGLTDVDDDTKSFLVNHLFSGAQYSIATDEEETWRDLSKRQGYSVSSEEVILDFFNDTQREISKMHSGLIVVQGTTQGIAERQKLNIRDQEDRHLEIQGTLQSEGHVSKARYDDLKEGQIKSSKTLDNIADQTGKSISVINDIKRSIEVQGQNAISGINAIKEDVDARDKENKAKQEQMLTILTDLKLRQEKKEEKKISTRTKKMMLQFL